MQKVDNLVFRDLRADEIEVRVGRTIGSDKVELLLYKTARTDRVILNETVGKGGWACQLDVKPLPDTVDKETGAVLRNFLVIGGIALKNEEGQWLWKWDAGSTESNFETQKSAASDAYKRAGFQWGIGESLYTAPKIIIPGGKYDTFKVSKIGYKDNKISDLRIVDAKGKVVFDYENFERKDVVDLNNNEDAVEVLRALCTELKEDGADTKELLKYFNYYSDKIGTWQRVTRETLLKLWNKWNEKSL